MWKIWNYWKYTNQKNTWFETNSKRTRRLSLKLVVKKGQAVCPHCHIELDVISKVNGLGSKPQGDSHLRKITKGIKMEIICAYLNNPNRLYTTREIIHRINTNRSMNNQIERSNLTRPHSELVDTGIITTHHKEKYDFYYFINVEKAKALLNGDSF